MKNIKLFLIAVSLLGMASCDSYLDTTTDDIQSPDELFATQASVEYYLNAVYAYVREDMEVDQNISAVNSSSFDIDYVWKNYTNFNMGIWDASNAQHGKWTMYYKGIREATYFMQNIDRCPPEKLPFDIRERWRAEARCLRAYYYSKLMRLYGPVILLKDELVDFTKPDADLYRARNTWDECVEWVVDEFDAVAENPYIASKQGSDYWGRMSKSIAMAYKSRLLLQSASAQFNGNTMYANVKNTDGTALFPTGSSKKSKWEQAAKAAKDVIDLDAYSLVKVYSTVDPTVIDPYASFRELFTGSQTSEMIFSYLETGGLIDLHSAPLVNKGWGGYSPTQQMVDSYAMDNGRYPVTGYRDGGKTPVIDQASGYSETGFEMFTHPIEDIEKRTSKMYVNREPRFYASVLYGGLKWFPTNNTEDQRVIGMYRNGNCGMDKSHNYFSTGYALVKYVCPGFRTEPYTAVKREIPYMRYAEILLNYIEATIECDRLDDADMFKYWNEIRARAGLKPILEVYPEAAGNKSKLTDLLRRERRVELAYEGNAFFDNRRWLIAGEMDGGAFYGMNIFAMGNSDGVTYPDTFFQRTVFETRVFNDSFYLYPIPQSAMNRNRLLVQNYKW